MAADSDLNKCDKNQGLTTGHFGVRVFTQVCIKNGITDLITHFVWWIKKKHKCTK